MIGENRLMWDELEEFRRWAEAVTAKKFVAVVEEFPNYLFHVLTVGEVVPDPEYVAAYASSIPHPTVAGQRGGRHCDLIGLADETYPIAR